MVLFEMSRGMAMNLLDNKERREWFWNQRRTVICIRLNPDFMAYVKEGGGSFDTPHTYQSRLTFKGLSPRQQLLHWRNQI